MDVYNGFKLEDEAAKENRDIIIEKFDEYSTGEINKTYRMKGIALISVISKKEKHSMTTSQHYAF